MDTKIKLHDIANMLDRAYEDYFKSDEPYAKSSGGAVSLTTSYGTYFDRDAKKPTTYYVTVWSYVFGPEREHIFIGATEEEAITKAYEAVKEWLGE